MAYFIWQPKAGSVDFLNALPYEKTTFSVAVCVMSLPFSYQILNMYSALALSTYFYNYI